LGDEVSFPLSVIKIHEADLLPYGQSFLDQRKGEGRLHQGRPYMGESIVIASVCLYSLAGDSSEDSFIQIGERIFE
jgi:hypothetical protein